MKTFSKILVANRGEIACRVFATAKRLGISTVAIYSDADANALHVRHADESVAIGGVTAAESYLQMDKVIGASRQTGADAVHPGYGFLSEQPDFPQQLEQAGITFIGPSPDAIKAMGDKITSKKLSAEAGVNTVPGYMGIIDNAEHCLTIANDIGYPVMIKASAGGGGKGMRIAWNADEVIDGFERSASEARSSFGDDRIFVEKFITDPRHIEIQVLADKHGNCIYLGERECSIQRRNQKVIEEAPSPFLDQATREAMGAQAVALSKAVDYSSAGTVEFIVDGDRNFYFLEMNTRLQVEHPVTELITGVDLVEQMINVAAGHPLTLKQSDIALNGWAMESRLYAEDPKRNFLPSIGRLVRYRPPATETSGDTIVRNDTGVEEGSEISMYYDPMIAKLCTWNKTRELAIDDMSDALDQFELDGVGNNLQFLSAIMQHPRFREGRLTTAFIDEEYPEGFSDTVPSGEQLDQFVTAAAVLSFIESSFRKTGRNEAGTVLAGASNGTEQAVVVRIAGTNTAVAVKEQSAGLQVTSHRDNATLTHSITTQWLPGMRVATLTINDVACSFQVLPHAGGYELWHSGYHLKTQVMSPRKAELAALMIEKVPADMSKFLLCPMPGLVVALHVQEGDQVEAGQALAVVEAMKMENVLQAQKSGVVSKLPVAVGDSLQVDDVIMEFE
ncbi:MAG: acetyl/propionyl/methylcrotonyl-CoA carboxylase subunit alpha [Pseudomonadota bacterium]